MADPLERRVNLLALLLETDEPLSAEQILDELRGQYPEGESARRGAFERDKAELRELGVPIEQVVLAGDRGGATAYRIDRAAYELPDLGLTSEERHALQLAVAAVRVGGEAGGLALLKLGGEADDGEAAPLVAALPASPALAVLFDANARRATVQFAYRGRPHELDPYGLLTRDGFWYVVGLEHGSGTRKTFRVDRIEGDVEAGPGGAFDVPEGFDPAAAVPDDPKQLGDGAAAVVALVEVDGLRAASVVREVGDESVARRTDDGRVVVRVPSTNLPAFRSWVLGLLDHALVLEPEEARADVVAWLEAVADAPLDEPTEPSRSRAKRAPGARRGDGGADTPEATTPGRGRRGPRPAGARMKRLLILLPWLMERGGATVAEAAARFQVSEQELVRDLEAAACCGLPPYLDEMIDVFVDDGEIHVGVPRLFTRPLRLTPSEGLALLAAGRAAQQLPGADAAGPLARALDKLAHAVAAAPNVAVDVQHPPYLEAVQAAVAAGERLALTYYVASRDELTERVVDPQLVFLDRGRWYLVADDQGAGGERHFRVDRIEALRRTGEEAVRRPVAPPTEAGWFVGAPDVVAVTLRLPASAAWVAEAFPVDRVVTEGDGALVVDLPVASERWLERLLLRAGPQARVLAPASLAAVGRGAAGRLLTRYRA